MTISNYTYAELDELYNSIDDKTSIIPKKLQDILNKHNIPLTEQEEIVDILVNLLHKNRVQTTFDDIRISSKNSNWFNRPGRTTTAYSHGVERGQLDEELEDYADITNTPLAPRNSIKKYYKTYKPKSKTKTKSKTKSKGKIIKIQKPKTKNQKPKKRKYK